MLSPRMLDGQLELENDDGRLSFPLSDEVRALLIHPDIHIDDFKHTLQSYCLDTNRDWATTLKGECPNDTAYRRLRVRLRTFNPT